MKYQKYLKSALLQKRSNNMATVAIIGGVAVGIAIGALFATKRGQKTKNKIIDFFADLTGKLKDQDISNTLGDVVENVRNHVKENAESLLGKAKHEEKMKDIKLENVTSNWKNKEEKAIFPNEPLHN